MRRKGRADKHAGELVQKVRSMFAHKGEQLHAVTVVRVGDVPDQVAGPVPKRLCPAAVQRPPEDKNRACHRITITNQYPTSMGTT